MRDLPRLAVLGLIGLASPGCGSAPAASEVAPAACVLRDEVYAPGGGQPLLADVYVPAGEGPFPLVVTLHSGSWQRGSRGRMADVARGLQAAGFVAVNVEYRLAPRDPFPAQLEDARAAVRWARAQGPRFRGDPRFVAACGYSAGGHLALLLGADQATDPAARVQAVVAGAAPADLSLLPDVPTVRRVFGVARDEAPDVLRQASPVHHVSRDDPPVLLLHGTDDWVVSPEHSRRMASALYAARVPVEYRELSFGHLVGELYTTDQVRHAAAFLRGCATRTTGSADARREESE